MLHINYVVWRGIFHLCIVSISNLSHTSSFSSPYRMCHTVWSISHQHHFSLPEEKNDSWRQFKRGIFVIQKHLLQYKIQFLCFLCGKSQTLLTITIRGGSLQPMTHNVWAINVHISGLERGYIPKILQGTPN